MLLGTAIEEALGLLGITVAKVEELLGRPCGCKERRDKLDALHFWAKHVITKKEKDARKYLRHILGSAIE